MLVPAGRPGRHSRHEKRRRGGQVFRPPVLGSVCRCDLILVVQDVGVGPVLQQLGDKRVVPSIRRLVQRLALHRWPITLNRTEGTPCEH